MEKVIADGHLVLGFDELLGKQITREADFLKAQGIVPEKFKPASFLEPSFMSNVLPDKVTYSNPK